MSAEDTKTPGDRLAIGLEASSDLSRETGHPGAGIRPCVATLLETALSKGEPPNRNQAALIIACEYYRIGLSFDEAERKLTQWNSQHSPPLKHSELQKAALNGYLGKYHYGCKNPVFEDFCIGTEECPFFQRVVSRRPKTKSTAFLDYGWQRYLSNRQVLLYLVSLPYLETRRRAGLSGLVCANHKQLAEACGIAVRRLGDDLRLLELAGLVEYAPGVPQRWEGKASEIRRVIPVPKPTRSVIQRLQAFRRGA
jgi:hypothetical protein